MQSTLPERISKTYPICLQFLNEEPGELETEVFTQLDSFEDFPEILALLIEKHDLPLFLPELARLEFALHQVRASDVEIPQEVLACTLNPTLQIIQLGWRHLAGLAANGSASADEVRPEQAPEVVLIWRKGGSDEVLRKVADDEDLLILKMVMENLEPEIVAEAGNLPVGAVDLALNRAVERGLILSPSSLLRRDESFFGDDCRADRDTFTTVEAFSLQWHLTQACDLHCRHCYDRSSRETLTLDKALMVLDDLRSFCRARHVKGHV